MGGDWQYNENARQPTIGLQAVRSRCKNIVVQSNGYAKPFIASRKGLSLCLTGHPSICSAKVAIRQRQAPGVDENKYLCFCQSLRLGDISELQALESIDLFLSWTVPAVEVDVECLLDCSLC